MRKVTIRKKGEKNKNMQSTASGKNQDDGGGEEALLPTTLISNI